MTIISHSTTLLKTQPRPFVDIRCRRCNKLMLKWRYQGETDIEVRCPRCSHTEVISLST